MATQTSEEHGYSDSFVLATVATTIRRNRSFRVATFDLSVEAKLAAAQEIATEVLKSLRELDILT